MRANPPSLGLALSIGFLASVGLSGCNNLALPVESENYEVQGHIDDVRGEGAYQVPDLELNGDEPKQTQRLIFDSLDLLSGFQLHPIYVLPAGEHDKRRDETGEIAAIMDQVGQLQEAMLGHRIQVDRRVDESIDVSFLASQYPIGELFSGDTPPGRKLLKEFLNINDPGENRKLYVFLVEAPAQIRGEEAYCGLTPLHKGYFAWHSTVLLGDDCSGVNESGVNYSARAIVHEVLHALGVDTHSSNSIDILCGYPYLCIPGEYPVASQEGEYFYSQDGVDVAEYRVWAGHLDDNILKYPCSRSFETACGLAEQRVILSKVCYSELAPAEILWMSGTQVESSQQALMTFDPSCPSESPYGVSAVVSATEPLTKQYRVKVGDSIGADTRRIHFQR